MSCAAAIEPTTKRMRNAAVILTDRMCEKRVDKRVRIYDKKCAGLFVSVITAGVATFFFKFTDRTTGKQRCKWLGVYSSGFMVERARAEVYALKMRLSSGENVAESLRGAASRSVSDDLISAGGMASTVARSALNNSTAFESSSDKSVTLCPSGRTS